MRLAASPTLMTPHWRRRVRSPRQRNRWPSRRRLQLHVVRESNRPLQLHAPAANPPLQLQGRLVTGAHAPVRLPRTPTPAGRRSGLPPHYASHQQHLRLWLIASLRRSAPSPSTSADRSQGDRKREAQAKRERAFQEQAEAVLGVPTLIAPGGRERVDPSSIVDGIEVIELAALPRETEASPAPSTHAPAVEEEPEFIRTNGSRARRGFSIVFGGGSLLLAALIAVQLAVIYRAELLASAPQARGALLQLCAVFGCTVGWPTQVDQLAVIGSELQTIPGTDVLELTAVIRNRAAFRQALPAVEVTLTDALNRPIARKVFTPADYLAAAGEPSSRIDDGLASGSDYTIRLFFEARGLQAAGFLVYPFFI